MICPQCGKSLASSATICPSCGLASNASTGQRCPVCGANLVSNATCCSHCGASLSPQEHPPTGSFVSYQPPSPDEQTGPPTTPYAQSRYGRPPITSPEPPATATTNPTMMIPMLTTSGQPSDETPADDETVWASVPPLMTFAEPEDVPFAMTSAANAADEPVAPTEPDDDELLGDESPDAERPAISAPKPPLPDYDTPDIERPAIHVIKPPLPDYDTPDVERTAVHPALVSAPVGEQLAPIDTAEDDETWAGSATAQNAQGTAAQVPNTLSSYLETYTAQPTTHVNAAAAGSAAPPPATNNNPGDSPSGDTIERIFGVQPPQRARTAKNAIQRLWLRYMPPDWAVAPWASIPIGALAALVIGLLVTAFGLIFWSRAIGYLLNFSSALGANEGLGQAIFSPNLLQLFLLEHGVPMSLTLGAPGVTGSFSALETLPLTGLSLIPACALILGGYVAAASDFSHRLRFSVLRGALVGPVYGVLLLLVAIFGSGTVKLAPNTTIELHPSLGVAFLAGLLWGTLLGALGGLLTIRRHHLFTTSRHPDLLAGASWGALIALGSGLLLATVALAAGMAAHVVGTPLPAEPSGNGLLNLLGGVVIAISLLIVVAPVGALWLFALGTGATIDSWFSSAGVSPGSGRATLGLLAAQHHPTSVVWWLLLLIPLASYIIGGRAAAHIARADSLRAGALAGLLMGVALSILLLVLTLLSRILIASDASIFGRQVITNQGIAPSAGAVFVLTLLVGGVVGALAGISALLAPNIAPILASSAAPLLPRIDPALTLATRPWDILDAARGQHPPRTTMRVLFYAAILLAILLLALFLVMALIGWIASHVAPISAVRGFDGFFAGIAVGVPLLLLASAAILAVTRALPPLLTTQRTHAPIIPRYPTAH